MNSFARSNGQDAVMIADAVPVDRIGEVDFLRAYKGVSTTWQSGLPLHWRSGIPAAPEFSKSRSAQLAMKRVFDVVMASFALIALFPLLAIVAVCIMATSRGPVLFKQQREGLNGKPFQALKFRSMRTEQCDTSGVAQTMKDDPRVTAIGKFIRKTSIDELPQLLNVLRGDMSLVGPRPHVAGMIAADVPYRDLVPYYEARLVMRPGITGWAQANGFRGMTVDTRSSIGRIDHDIAYVQNFSLGLDLKIIIKTVANEFLTGSGH